MTVSSASGRTASLPVVPASGQPAAFAMSQHYMEVTHEMLEPGPKKIRDFGESNCQSVALSSVLLAGCSGTIAIVSVI